MTTTYLYVCTVAHCEDRQSKFCGYSYRCPFCGEGLMILVEKDETYLVPVQKMDS